MQKGNISEIISLFRKERTSRPILLLGAGASFKSGIPMAADAFLKIAKASYKVNEQGEHWRNFERVKTSDWLPYVKKQKWYKEVEDDLSQAFPLAVENLLTPKAFRKEFLLNILESDVPISEGYYYLAEILKRNLCWNVLTTNFDSLILKAFNEKASTKRIIEINKTIGDINGFQIYGQKQIVYLHGALEYYTDRVENSEIKKLDERLVSKLRPCLENGPLVVIGYRGAEASVMKNLLLEGAVDSNNYPLGIYWCNYNNEQPHKFVNELAETVGNNFKIVNIDGFDELMEQMHKNLKGEYYLQEEIQINIESELPFDEKILLEKTYDDLDENLIKVTLKKYFEKLTISSFSSDKYIEFLLSEKFLVKKDGILHPTNAFFLMFGKNIESVFPYVLLKFEMDKLSRSVFEGNLVEQYNNLMEFFDSEDINPYIRIKKEHKSIESVAYKPKALRELLVNMIVHRDYSISEYSKIEYITGEEISFTTIGGLPEKVINNVDLDQDGFFEPVRGLSSIRNKLIADVFFGIDVMDKLGTGMPQVKEEMRENSGEARFQVLQHNKFLKCTLLQARQSNPKIDNIADPLVNSELYITNLLPFGLLPDSVYEFPIYQDISNSTLKNSIPRKDYIPQFINDTNENVLNKKLISFADLEFFQEEFKNLVDFKNRKKIELKEYMNEENSRRRLVWLVLKHFENYLKEFKDDALVVDYKNKKAYFELISGVENKISYVSRLNRKATRAVVKRRETKTRVFHENEGIVFGLEYLADQFLLSIKPIYMFTQKDGKTPLQSYLRSRYSTSRMKFDRNKNVDDDLHFWLKYLSKGKRSINIGGNDVDNLIIDAKYLENEVLVGENLH